MMNINDLTIGIPTEEHVSFAQEIENLLVQSAQEKSRGLNLKKRDYLAEKMLSGNAVIATKDGKLAGFCYLRRREKADYVSISGIVMTTEYRKTGLSKAIIKEAFALARSKYPEAKIFSLTTSPIIMNINNENGYKPVNYSRLSTSENFWSACSDCLNYETLKKNNYTRCLCSAMLYNPFSFNIEDENELNQLSVDAASNIEE